MMPKYNIADKVKFHINSNYYFGDIVYVNPYGEFGEPEYNIAVEWYNGERYGLAERIRESYIIGMY